jgi:hypothetical protein
VRDRQLWIAAIAVVICVPVLFASLGGSRAAGLAIGAVLVIAGVLASIRGGR